MRLLTLLIALLSLIIPLQANAQDSEYLKIRLLAERTSVQGGEEVWIGIEQSIAPEWHTYWKNPGDAGLAPIISWELPEGFTIGEIQYPAPHKIPYDDLLNYGYQNNVILLQKLTIPENITNEPIALIANTEILVCKETCIPQSGRYSLTLNNPQAPNEDNTAYLAAALGKLPQQASWGAAFQKTNDHLEITIPANAINALPDIDLTSLEFIPEEWGVVSNPAKLGVTRRDDGALLLTQQWGGQDLEPLGFVAGLLNFRDKNNKFYSFSFQAQPALSDTMRSDNGSGEPDYTAIKDKSEVPISLIYALFLALIGGLILNLMPCVFPVLSIKALSLIKLSDKELNHARLHGLSYTAGIILSFLLIAGVLIALQAGGAQIGWGFQLQHPVVVTILAYFLFIIGLNLSGVFEITGHFGNVGNKLAQGKGLSSSFFTGVLATLVATPCTAPFMGVAMGYALTQPPAIALSVFATLGLGLALPYLALTFIPALQKRLPRPGEWMEIFRQFLAFPMFAAAIWMVWVLDQQSGNMGVLSVLLGMLSIGFGLWLLQHTPKSRYWHYKIRILSLIAFIIPLASLPALSITPIDNQVKISHLTGEETSFSREILEMLLEGNDPVFVEMTAAWCLTCKINKAAVLDARATQELFARYNVHYLIGDWTNRDKNITQYINKFGRTGVPLYVFYGARDSQTKNRPEPILLPQILTPALMKNTIK